MKELLDILKRGFSEENAEIGPKLAAGIACFGAALVLNALVPGSHDDTIRRKDQERRDFNARRPHAA